MNITQDIRAVATLTPVSLVLDMVREQMPLHASQNRMSLSYEPVTRMTDMSCRGAGCPAPLVGAGMMDVLKQDVQAHIGRLDAYLKSERCRLQASPSPVPSCTTRTGCTDSQLTSLLSTSHSFEACVYRKIPGLSRKPEVENTYGGVAAFIHVPTTNNPYSSRIQEMWPVEADPTVYVVSAFHKIDPRTMVSFSSTLAGRCRCPLSCASGPRFLRPSHLVVCRLLPIYVLPFS